MAEYMVLVDGKNDKAGVIEFKDDLQYFYGQIGCRLVAMVPRRIERKEYTIICDEEGTFVDDPLISTIDNIGNGMFVGTLLVAGDVDNEGRQHGITKEEAMRILDRYVQKMSTRLHPEPHWMLTNVEYA